MNRFAYHKQLLEALEPIVSTLTASVRGHGQDAHGNKIKTIEAQLAAIPSTLAIIARWAERNKPE